jgi:hypothetical protein
MRAMTASKKRAMIRQLKLRLKAGVDLMAGDGAGVVSFMG